MKILANDGIAPAGTAVLEAAGFEVVTENVAQEDLVDAINNENYVALLVRSATTVRKPLIDACPNLKLIGRGGVGMDNIDVDYARSKGLHVINTPAASSQSVAELVFAHLFSMARMTYDANRHMPTSGNSGFKTLKKKYGKGVELRGKTLGIIGMGRIGSSVAEYALGCGMKVIGSNLTAKPVTVNLTINGDQQVAVDVPCLPTEQVIAESDFLTLHIPAPADKSAVIGAAEFNQMKDGVMLVNAARGGVVDEDALLQALESGKVAHAALDVFVGEPAPREDLLANDRVALTPHIGGATVEAQSRIGTELADKIIELLNH